MLVMTNFKSSCAALLFLALIAGCSKPEDKFVGKWDGKMDLSQEMMDMAEAAKAFLTPEQIKQMEDAQKMIADARVVLDLKDDGTYVMTTTGLNESHTVNGKWTLSEDGKTITAESWPMTEAEKKSAVDQGISAQIVEQLADEDLKCVVSEDMNTLTYVAETMGASLTIRFVRQ